tara:strand:+ start:160 stop:378 length:219 start_codon:yes stop_codon:yes gene_type:complete
MKEVGMKTLKITQEVASSTHNMLAFISNEFPVYSELSNMEEKDYEYLIIEISRCRFALDLITDALVKIEVEG